MASNSLIDLMSSPDPLTDAAPSSVIPSSRRVTRSQTSHRFFALGSSPRKQTFELDVGNELSPQKILVTVEADDFGDPNVKRRLFQSPTPKRTVRQKATTTTVPLRGLTDDENGGEGATPRRRGRPPKSGTPRKATPRKATPRKPATPKKATGTPTTARRGRPPTPGQGLGYVRSKSESSRDVLQSETSVGENQATPRPSSIMRRVPKRKTISPAKDDAIPSSQPRKRGRPRKRQSNLPDDITALSEQESTADAEVEDNASVAPTEDNVSVAGNQHVEASGAGAGADFEDDIWLATLSDQATPVARRWQGRDAPITESIEQDLPEHAHSQPSHSDADYSQPEEYMDFGGMELHSDVESQSSENIPMADAQDTVMAGEEFTMISIGSLPSMQQNSSMLASSMMAPEPQELGEATSLIINRTLEELRQSRSRLIEEIDNLQTGPPTEPAKSGEISFVQNQETSLFSQPKSPQTWNRSPRRVKAQPLAKQLAVKNLRQEENTGSPARPSAFDKTEAQDTSAYDDSFSEIPEAVLEAATPRRPRQPQPEEDRDNAAANIHIQPSIERQSTVNHSNPQSESNRLLTPDETPSVPSDDEGERTLTSPTKPSAAEVEMRSSPPIISPSLLHPTRNEASVRHSRTHSTETPTERQSNFRSPAIAALNAAQHVELAPPETHRRPTLSPIVRAGRALQFITSDPPSPPGRDSVLRSPFRGSVTKSSPPPELPAAAGAQSPPPAAAEPPAKPVEKSWLSPFTQIKDFVVQGAQAFSPRPASAAPAGMEDPFGPGPAGTARPATSGSLFGFGSRQTQSQEAATSLRSSTRAEPLHDDDGYDEEMSWQAESPTRPSSRGSSASHRSNIHGTRGSSASNRTRDQGSVEDRFEEQAVAEQQRLEEEERRRLEEEEQQRLEEEEEQQRREQEEQRREEEQRRLMEEEQQRWEQEEQQRREEEEQRRLEQETQRRLEQEEQRRREEEEQRRLEQEEQRRLEREERRRLEQEKQQRLEQEEQRRLEEEERQRLEEEEKRRLQREERRRLEREERRRLEREERRRLEQEEQQHLEEEERQRLEEEERLRLEEEEQKHGHMEDELPDYVNEVEEIADSQPDLIDYRHQEPELHPMEDEEEEEDIWAIEAQRPTPHANKQAPPPAREPAGLPPRRSKLPSPWRTNSRRLVYSDELQDLAENSPARTETDEFSMLSRQSRQGQATMPAANPTPHAPPANKNDLSAFFSSPAVIPDAPVPGFGLFRALDGRNAEKSSQQASAPLRRQIVSTFQKPQSFGNSLFPQPPPEPEPRVQRPQSFGNNLFPHPPPEPNPRVQKPPSVPEKEFHIDRSNRDSSFLSPSRQDSREALQSVSRSPSPATPERSTFSHVPQKMNFTPRSREAANTLFNPGASTQAPSNPLFGGRNQVPSFFPSAAGTQEEEELEDESMAMSPDLSFEIPAPPVRHFPNRAMSPTKSSFRSPMKPKTPGRLVEFTSSTLSPLAQEQARAEREARAASPEKEAPRPAIRFSSSSSSTSSSSNSNGNRAQNLLSRFAASTNIRPSDHDKENHQWENDEQHSSAEEDDHREQAAPSYLPSFNPRSSSLFANVNAAASSLFRKPAAAAPATAPLTPKATSSVSGSGSGSATSNTNLTTTTLPLKHHHHHQHHPQLSQTHWTRDHWLRLDELLQSRRKGTLQFQLTVRHHQQGPGSSTTGGRNHRLLGKQVTAQGETLTLETWHLDVVEAFKREVCGGVDGEGGEGAWTDEALAKRLFALMVGEERRRAGRVDRLARGRDTRERERERVVGW